jgi:predicted metal-dependent peptidase
MRNFFQNEDLSPRELFDLAWEKLLRWQPFYGSQMFALEIIESSKYPTMATDGSKLYFNPDYLRESTEEHRLEVEFHEILHVILKHHLIAAVMEKKLGEKFDMQKLQYAGDYEVNWILKACGCKIENGIYDAKYHGWEIEAIYFDLPDNQSSQSQQSQGQNESGETGENGSDSGEGNEPDSSGETEQQSDSQSDANSPDNGDSSQESSQSGNEDNSGGNSSANGDDSSSGSSSPNDSLKPFNGDHGAVLIPRDENGEKLDEEALETLEKELEGRLISGAKIAEKQGHPVPEVEGILDRFMKTEVDWKEHLASFFTEKFLSHKTWARSNRRYRQHGMYMPAKYRESRGRLVLGRDVSGSVDRDKKRFFGEVINELILSLECELDIMVIDFHHGIYNHYETCSEDAPLVFDDSMSGGTNYRPLFDLIHESNFGPDAIVVLTDLQCYQWPSDPGVPTLWAFAGYGEAKSYPVPFGETITL